MSSVALPGMVTSDTTTQPFPVALIKKLANRPLDVVALAPGEFATAREVQAKTSSSGSPVGVSLAQNGGPELVVGKTVPLSFASMPVSVTPALSTA